MPEHVTLSAFLAPLTKAIHSVAVSAWVVAEIAEISGDSHLYVTLIEADSSGNPVAQLRTMIWQNSKARIVTRFTDGMMGKKLAKGMNVLVKLRPSLHAVYGLGATIEDIDPAYTLGEAARKLMELRERLKKEGAYERQPVMAKPTEFTHVAVISPVVSAGGGDFHVDANRLEAAGLCRFQYYTAKFQGERTSTEIVDSLRAVYHAHKNTPFDAVIILRGGGGGFDLAWLNDYAIGNAISKMPLPVLVAIGHERDKLLLEEIANGYFDTPSKAIGYVMNCIFNNARSALGAFETICAATAKTHAMVAQAIDRAHEVIHTASRHQFQAATVTVTSSRNAITAGTKYAIEVAAASLDKNVAVIREASFRQVEFAGRNIESSDKDVVAGAEKSIATADHGMGRCRAIIHGAAIKGIAVSEVELDGRRRLIRDRSFLAIKNTTDRAQASAEFVHELGPEKTLQRGFAIARHSDRKVATRKAQINGGEKLELQFADGAISAIADPV